MINKNQECDVISDLLPLYLEGRTSKESNMFVEQHMEHCEECRRDLHYMRRSYEELLSMEDGDGKARRSGKIPPCKFSFFARTKGRIFVGIYLGILLCVWIYILYVLLG